MALSVQSILKRLKFMTRPSVIASSVVLVVVGIFASEYIRHPEWFGAYSTEEDVSPSEEAIDLSGLTPEEQAAVTDIDNLTVLFNDLGISANENAGIPDVDQDDEQPQDLLFQDLLGAPISVEGEPLSSSDNPFDEYIDKYQFVGRSLENDVTVQFSENQSRPSGLNLGTGNAQSPFQAFLNAPNGDAGSPQVSELQRALQTQNETNLSETNELAETADSEDGTASNDGRRSPDAINPLAQTGTRDESTSASGGAGSQGVTLPGVPFTFSPTTTQMAPPAGTTGYVPPASLEFVQPIPGSSNAGSNNAAGAPSFPVGSGNAGFPAAPAGAAVPNIGTPQVDVSNGTGGPNLPSAVTAPTAPDFAPLPSAVDPAPGRRIGNGCINTFADPSEGC